MFDPDWDKFLVFQCPSQIHMNKLLVPPQNLFLPPQSRYRGAGPALLSTNKQILSIERGYSKLFAHFQPNVFLNFEITDVNFSDQ